VQCGIVEPGGSYRSVNPPSTSTKVNPVAKDLAVVMNNSTLTRLAQTLSGFSKY